jgi:hypothetical protein
MSALPMQPNVHLSSAFAPMRSSLFDRPIAVITNCRDAMPRASTLEPLWVYVKTRPAGSMLTPGLRPVAVTAIRCR